MEGLLSKRLSRDSTGFSATFISLIRVSGSTSLPRRRAIPPSDIGCLPEEEGEIRDRVMDAIISMCEVRILERLNLGRKKTRKARNSANAGKSIIELLEEAVDELRCTDPTKSLDSETQSFVTRARSVIHQANAWKKHSVPAEMKALIREIFILRSLPKWNIITEGETARSRMEKMIKRVSRYFEAAIFLCQTAKKFPIARKMTVVAVDLPADMLNQVRPQTNPSDFGTAFSRLGEGKKSRAFIHPLIETTDQIAEAQFLEYTSAILEPTTVHAEIQILAYCDLYPRGRYPRVVCSSKHACFLCNQFITLHAKMYTPSSHGRLYHRWRLPNFGTVNMKSGFNAQLEKFGMDSLKTMRQTNKRIKHPDPNESALHSLLLSETSLLNGIVAGSTGPEEINPNEGTEEDSVPQELENTKRHGVDEPDSEDEGSSTSDDVESVTAGVITENDAETSALAPLETKFDAVEERSEERSENQDSATSRTGKPDGNCEDGSCGDDRPEVAVPPSVVVVPPTPVPDETRPSPLAEFEWLPLLCDNGALNELKRGDVMSHSRDTETLGLLVDNPDAVAGSSGVENKSQCVRYTLEWLDSKKAREIRLDQDIPIVDVDTLDTEVSIPLERGQRKVFYLSSGKSVLRVHLLPSS